MDPFSHAVSDRLRTCALALPETSEGTSCVNRAFKVRKKNFLFVGEPAGDEVRVMLKLGPSLDAARALADPRVGVGKTGWVTVRFAAADPFPLATLEGWMRESYCLLGPKALARALQQGDASGA